MTTQVGGKPAGAVTAPAARIIDGVKVYGTGAAAVRAHRADRDRQHP